MNIVPFVLTPLLCPKYYVCDILSSYSIKTHVLPVHLNTHTVIIDLFVVFSDDVP